MARRSSLGPFPKRCRWREIVERGYGAPAAVADLVIEDVRRRLESLKDDEQGIRAAVFFAALPIASRSPDPLLALAAEFGILWAGSPETTLKEWLGEDSAVKRAALAALTDLLASPLSSQEEIIRDEWSLWRRFDGSAFCDLSRLFFSKVAEEHLRYYAEARLGPLRDRSILRDHGWDLSLITRSFSARWFNKCAVGQIPDRGSIRWYLGHCLGKLDMELEREFSTHVEPLPNPFRRRKREPEPALDL